MTVAIQKNIPLKLFDAVTPANAAESDVYALPAVATILSIVVSLATPGATATSTVSIFVANGVSGPWVLLGSTLVPTQAAPVKTAVASVAYTHIKAVLSSVTVDSSTLTVTVNAKDN
jgi:hypothetical protein